MPTSITYLPYTILLLGILIFVHESGHFLVAKALKVKVLRFSIGFGPPILSFTRGDTEYRIAWFPLGGYVKMAGEQPYDELPPEEARYGFLAQAPWKRMLIVAAGPVFNLVFPVLVFFIVLLGVSEHATTLVGTVEPGMPAAEAGIRPGDRIVSIEGQKVELFDDIVEQLQTRYDRPTVISVDRDGKQITLTLTPLRSTQSDPLESVTRGQIGIRPYQLPPVLGVPAGSPAAAAGLKSFDRVVAINGRAVGHEGDLEKAVAAAQGELEVQVHRAEPLDLPGVGGTNPGLLTVRLPRQPGDGYAALGAESSSLYLFDILPDSPAAKVGLKRGDRLVALDGTPLRSFAGFSNALTERVKDQAFTLTWRSPAGEEKTGQTQQARSTEKDQLGNVSGQLFFGVASRISGPEDVLSPEVVKVRMPVGKALVKSLQIVPQDIAKIATVLGMMITGKVPLDALSGPVGLAQMTSVAAEQGFDRFLQLMAIISINLGVVNLLPIPILDGFHLLAAGWEAIRRRPISMRAREVANWVGLVVLVSLIARVLYNDIFLTRR
ncbi:MAG TPA: RIP metalloprotease RseP [Myxococcales bacterium]|nr:RIP metalloprotease RseP [Myxococcales bacterium]